MSRNKKRTGFFNLSPESPETRINLNIFDRVNAVEAPSITAIAEGCDIPAETVAVYVNNCVKEGLLKISGTGEQDTIGFSSDKKRTLGIGFTDAECVITQIDMGGQAVFTEHHRIDPIKKMKGRVKELKAILDTVRSDTRLAESDCECAGVAVPEVMRQANPKAYDLLLEGASHIFNCDAFGGNAATAAAYAERACSAKAKGKDLLYMHSDVGDGVIIKNEMIFEADTKGSSRERSFLRPWNQFSVVATARNLVNKGVGTDIVNMVDGHIEDITLDVVLEAAQKGDELAEDLIKRAGLALGVRTAYLVNMFRPEMVVLGGGTERKEGDFAGFVRESARKFCLKEMVDKVEIIPGVLGKEAPSVGAGLLCRREVFMEV